MISENRLNEEQVNLRQLNSDSHFNGMNLWLGES